MQKSPKTLGTIEHMKTVPRSYEKIYIYIKNFNTH